MNLLFFKNLNVKVELVSVLKRVAVNVHQVSDDQSGASGSTCITVHEHVSPLLSKPSLNLPVCLNKVDTLVEKLHYVLVFHVQSLDSHVLYVTRQLFVEIVHYLLYSLNTVNTAPICSYF
jgi:hypothetical protein